MKVKLLVVALLGLSLVGCGDKLENNPSAVAASPTVSNESMMPPTGNELKSADGKVSVAVFSPFEDKLDDVNALLENIKAEELLFLKKNSINDTVVYAVKHDKVFDSKTDLAKLEKILKNDKSLKNLDLNLDENGRIAYHFSHTESTGETTLNESCVLEAVGQQTYVVCANSPDEDLVALDTLVKQTVIAK